MSSEPADFWQYVVCSRRNGRLLGPVKVGITSNLKARLATLQTANHRELGYAMVWWCGPEYIARLFEDAFHQLQAVHHVRGEWFEMEPVQACRIVESYRRQADKLINEGKYPGWGNEQQTTAVA